MTPLVIQDPIIKHMIITIITMTKLIKMKITSEELYNPPHHPRAWTFSRVNSTSEHHKLLSLDTDHDHDHDHDGHDDDDRVYDFTLITI